MMVARKLTRFYFDLVLLTQHGSEPMPVSRTTMKTQGGTLAELIKRTAIQSVKEGISPRPPRFKLLGQI